MEQKGLLREHAGSTGASHVDLRAPLGLCAFLGHQCGALLPRSLPSTLRASCATGTRQEHRDPVGRAGVGARGHRPYSWLGVERK